MNSEMNEKVKKLKGWKLSVFKVLNEHIEGCFVLQDIYKFEDQFQAEYPNNQFIKPKIRQTLQYLRDLGFVEFISDGHFKKMW